MFVFFIGSSFIYVICDTFSSILIEGTKKCTRLTFTDVFPDNLYIVVPIRSVVFVEKANRMSQFMNQSTTFTRGLPGVGPRVRTYLKHTDLIKVPIK